MQPSILSVFAPAKINLFLHVGTKRPDGFHELESLVSFAKVGDTLVLEPSETLELILSGPFADNLTADGDNLVLKAANALADAAGVRAGARITLSKVLPVASGIGGGSADAAAALRGLNTLWGIDFPPERLRTIGASLGSDIPVCVESESAWMAGRGEHVTILDGIPNLPMLLVNPGVGVPTGPVFKALEARHGVGLPPPAPFAGPDDLMAYLKATANDLEPPALQIAPVVGEVLSAIAAQEGALLTRMSGSGATCFGLFETVSAADAALADICTRHENWWAAVG